jgi:Mrp family chromosome partitioning ATPase
VTVVLVTVAGPSGRRDLVVPADVPIGDLLGPIAAAAADGQPGMAGQARWRLGLLSGDPLPPDRSLTTCGVGDGATLTLTLDPAPATVRQPLTGSTMGVSRGAAPLAVPGAATTLASRGGAGGRWSLVGRWRRGSGSRDPGDEPLEAAIAAPRLGRCAVVGVVSATAGLGRTTVAALLASVLAATRQGLTVAVDAHPGPGSLTDRLDPDLDVPAGDLLGLLDHPMLTTGELTACLTGREGRGPGSRSASPALVAGVDGSRALGRRAWTLLVQGLARHADALVLDCGPGLGGLGARAAVGAADQLVLVTEPEPSPESRRVAGALADLGHAVVVAAGPSPADGFGSGSRSASGVGSRSISPAVLARLLPGARGVVPLPHLPPAVPPREWAEVPPEWRRPARRLAYLLVADWPALGMTAPSPG